MQKNWFALLLLVVATAASAQSLQPTPPLAPPALALAGIDGRVHRLADYRGKVVLVNFWASWCGPCREETPSIERLRRSMRGEPFVVFSVDVGESARAVRRFADAQRLGSLLLLDREGDVARAWGARALPTSFVVDPAGKVRYSYVGAFDWAAPAVRRAITGLMKTMPALRTASCLSDRS
jgi:thiol-disulfide isomerase/thioredoxin